MLFIDSLLAALSPFTLAMNFVGVMLGMIVGALPGLGSVVAITICLPFTFGMASVSAIALLLGVYCGSICGGSIAAVLINTPGTPQSAATAFDGYPMARAGKPGKAIGWALAASIFGGVFSCVILTFAAPQIAVFALQFGPLETCALILMGLTCISSVSANNQFKGLAMGVLGYLYLCSILLLYYVDVNALVVKVWALKASVSVFASLSLAFYYAYRTAAVIRRSEERRLLEREVAEREHEGDKLQDIVRRDELTGCCSRRFAEARIDELLGRGRPLSLAFVDVNDLKGVNDAGGHEDGDRYLTCVAAVLDDVASGPDDVLGRLGGDEFVVALPDVPAAVLRKRLEEARHRLRTQSDSERSPFSMSVSVGVASARPGDDAASLVARADAAMYEDKRAGREAR